MHRVNKPKVFLSHSNKDKEFIDQLASDLRKCHIDYWLDTEEIRDGKSWLKVIFEDGLPTCDVVIVYLTQNSIDSKMVGKEIDSSLINQLSDSGVAFLPYVNKSELRSNIRIDLQTLHCREWNKANYYEVLPSVVSEIWHSYLERTINIAITQEKARRLELELELKKQKDTFEGTPFSASEETDFKYIYNLLNKPLKLTFKIFEKRDVLPSEIDRKTILFTYIEIIQFSLLTGYAFFDWHSFAYDICFSLKRKDFPNESDAKKYYGLIDDVEGSVIVTLRILGITRNVLITDINGRSEKKDEFTEKAYKFHYWLGYHNLLKEDITLT